MAACLAAAFAGVLSAAYSAPLTWTNTTLDGSTQNWSTSASWNGGSGPAPAAGGSATGSIAFFPNTTTSLSGTGVIDSVNDLGGAYVLNSLILNGKAITTSGTTTVNLSGGDLQLDGVSPTVTLAGVNNVGKLVYTISNNITLNADTTFTGNGGAAFGLTGAMSGTGSLTKAGSSTLSLNGSTTSGYSGNVIVNGGFLQTNAGTASFYTLGSLTVASGATFYMANGAGGPTTAAFSGLYGNGTIAGARGMAINYNGAVADPFGGTFSGGGFVKGGVGTLELTNPSFGGGAFVNTGLTVTSGTVSLAGLPSTFTGAFNVNNGTLLVTGTSGTVLGASSLNASSLSGGQLIVRPTLVSEAADISVAGLIASGAYVGQFRANNGGTLILDKNGNRSLTLTLGNVANGADATHATMFSQVSAGAGFGGAGGLIIAPASGLADLGNNVKLVVLQNGNSTAPNDATLVGPSGIVNTNVIGQDNDAGKSGSFLTYVGAHAGGDTGFKAATYATDAANAAFYAGATTNTTVEDVTTSGSLAASGSLWAFRVGSGVTVDLNGQTLTTGTGGNANTAGVILNGGTIAGATGTLAFGSSMGEIYVSKANGTISAKLTGSFGINVFGPGVLRLTGVNSGLNNGAITINNSTLDASGSSLPGILLVLKNGVLQSSGSFTRNLSTSGGSNVYFTTLINGGGSGGFAARGGALSVLLNNSNAAPLVWGSTANFLQDGGTLLFGSATADSKVDFQNDLDLGGATAQYSRIINVTQGVGTDYAEISGKISGANPSNLLVKNGDGALLLSGSNSYAGQTIVNGGRLIVSGTIGGSGALVQNGATLGGAGRVGALTVDPTGGTIAPGNLDGLTASTVGTLSTGNVDLSPAGTKAHLSMQLGGATAGGVTASDGLNVTGVVNLTGADLKLSLATGYTPAFHDLLFLVINDGADAVTGQFGALNGVAGTLAEGGTVVVGGQAFILTYRASFEGAPAFTGGNDIALQAVPEPQSWIMILGGLGTVIGFGNWRKRRAGA